jgi:hypothetical protein
MAVAVIGAVAGPSRRRVDKNYGHISALTWQLTRTAA